MCQRKPPVGGERKVGVFNYRANLTYVAICGNDIFG